MLKSFMAPALLLALTGTVSAQSVADNMTCAQAIAQYERAGFIYKIANGKDVVPIRGGTPVSRASTLTCGGRGAFMTAITVKTTDKRRCEVALVCRVSGGG